MQPRIYTYKITFEEVPYWYWGVHKERRFGELYLGSPVTHRWMWEFYTPRIQILEFFPYTEEGWKEANAVECRLIGPDLNHPFCLNEHCGGTTSSEASRRGAIKVHSVKNEEGKSKHAVENGKKVMRERNKLKDADGKSVTARKAGLRSHEERTPDGRSVRGISSGARLHAKKTEDGRSLAGVKGSTKTHSRKNSEGKSLVGVNWGVKGAMKLHAERTEDGRSIRAIKASVTLTRKEWQCTVTGKISTAAGLSHWQRARGIDTSLRVKVAITEE